MSFLSDLSNFLWGGPLLAAFLLVGGYYSLRTGFFQIFHFPLWWRTTVGTLLRGKKTRGAGISQVQAMSAALASVIGTGSIAGVATAIFYGGPGAVFWMWVSALLGMMTGYAEKALAVRYREKGEDGQWKGGPMEYMRKGLRLPKLAAIFALFGTAEALAGSNLAQANSIATTLSAAFGTNRWVTGLILAAIVSIVLVGGIGQVGRFSELLVPLMAAVFVGGGMVVILINRREIPAAFGKILSYAFAPRAAVGGFSMGIALRYGVARGVFTSEAGLGMSAIVHACAAVEEPAEQGMWGIFEVFFSTILICTVTALVILTSDVYVPEQVLAMIRNGAIPDTMLGAPLVSTCFRSVLGEAGEWIVTVSLILFAFTSLLGGGYCGRRGLETLTGSKWMLAAYQIGLPVFIVIGAAADLTAVWDVTDLLAGLLALPNLLALMLLAPEALWLLRKWVGRQEKKKKMKNKT